MCYIFHFHTLAPLRITHDFVFLQLVDLHACVHFSISTCTHTFISIQLQITNSTVLVFCTLKTVMLDFNMSVFFAHSIMLFVNSYLSTWRCGLHTASIKIHFISSNLIIITVINIKSLIFIFGDHSFILMICMFA